MIEGIIIEGFIYSLLTLGVFLTFRVINFADLTVEGSFPLGAAVCAISLYHGTNPFFALLFSFLISNLAGILTGFLYNKLRIPDLLSGILTLTMLYSINIRILKNRANLPLINKMTIFNMFNNQNNSFVAVIFIVILIFVLIYLFLITDIGLVIRACGNNENLIVNMGVKPEKIKLFTIGLANGIIGVSGGLVAQYQGFADVNLGQGIIVGGLASLMIGEVIISEDKLILKFLRVIAGTLIFKTIMYIGRFYGYIIHMTPNDLKLITGLLVVIALIITNKKRKKR